MARVINVSNTGRGEFQTIPAGTRAVATVYAIEEVPVKSGDNAGKDQLDLTFKIQEGQYSGREIRYVKIPLYDGNASWKLYAFAEAVGWQVKDGSVEIPDNIQSVLGTSLVIKVTEQPPNQNGQVFNSVGGFAKLDANTRPVEQSKAAPSWGSLNK